MVDSTVKDINSKRVGVDSFQDLEKILSEAPDYSSYEYKCQSNGVLTLYKDGLTKFFISANVWSDEKRRADYIKSATGQGISVICVGTSEELDSSPSDESIQQICIPLALNSLKSAIKSIHNFQSVIDKVETEKRLIEKASQEVKYVLSISRELNGERDIKKLLNLILLKAREITNADAGSIYTTEIPGSDIREGMLNFRFTQNDSIKQNLNEFELQINEQSIVGSAVIHGTTISIPDLYKLDTDPKKNPFGARHDRSWDKRLGYESHSMLTMPMYDISHSVVGVIQLINRKKIRKNRLHNPEDFAENVVEFSETDIEYAEIVAQQAGIALENANLHDEIQKLFDGFVTASVTAIEQRDPTTSGHSHRVAKLTLGLADMVARTTTGEFAAIRFNEDQKREIKYASLLHDFGKLGVRENVLVKAKKLYPWQHDLIMERFKLIRSSYEIEYLTNAINLLQNPNAFPMGVSEESFSAEKIKKCTELDAYMDFIEKANQPTVLEQGGFELLKDIASCKFDDHLSKDRPFLSKDELKSLSVSRGSLTADEFAEIQSHVTHTYEFLRQIPWGPKLQNIPQIAAKHHEKLDGSGYPTSAAAHEIPIQSRMMTIADIFDALTASDRPYKKAIPVERALDILGMEVKGGKVDSGLYDIFLEAKVYEAAK